MVLKEENGRRRHKKTPLHYITEILSESGIHLPVDIYDKVKKRIYKVLLKSHSKGVYPLPTKVVEVMMKYKYLPHGFDILFKKPKEDAIPVAETEHYLDFLAGVGVVDLKDLNKHTLTIGRENEHLLQLLERDGTHLTRKQVIVKGKEPVSAIRFTRPTAIAGVNLKLVIAEDKLQVPATYPGIADVESLGITFSPRFYLESIGN